MITFGEKEALSAYAEFCKLQQGFIEGQNKLIESLTRAVEALSSPQASFSLRNINKTPMSEASEDIKFLYDSHQIDKGQMEDMLKELGFQNSTVEDYPGA
jgi:hypothetical protein